MKIALLYWSAAQAQVAESLSARLDASGLPVTVEIWDAAQAEGCPLPGACDSIVLIGDLETALSRVMPQFWGEKKRPAITYMDGAGGYIMAVADGQRVTAGSQAALFSKLCGAQPVIFSGGAGPDFSLQDWIDQNHLRVDDPAAVATLQLRIEAGETLTVASDFSLQGTWPKALKKVKSGAKSADVRISYKRDPGHCLLHLVPPVLVAGLGCKQDTTRAAIEQVFQQLLQAENVHPLAFYKVASIQMEAEEPGILAFCRQHGLLFETFSKEELKKAEGEFTQATQFTKMRAGIDNICERSAVCGSLGQLIVRMVRGTGAAFAVSQAPFALTGHAAN